MPDAPLFPAGSDRVAAMAIFAGSVAGLLVMATHPTGHDVVRNAEAGLHNGLATGVHALALVAEAAIVAGTLALVRRLRTRRDLALGGWVFFALAAMAVVVAATASGFVAPAVTRGIGEASEAERAAMLGALRYTGLWNQAFARVHVLLAGGALLLWSAAILAGRELPRALGAAGIALGIALVAVGATGWLRLDIHGFGLVVLLQALWFAGVARVLWHEPEPG